MKGPSGSTTVTQNNTPWNAAALQKVYNTADSLYQNNPVNYYPGSTLYQAPELMQGYYGLVNEGQHLGGTVDLGNGTFGSAETGGMGIFNSPAYPYLSAIGSGNSAAGQGAANFANNGLGQIGGAAADSGAGYGASISDLARMAPGATSGASSYLSGLAPGSLNSAGRYGGAIYGSAATAPNTVYPAVSSLMGNAGSAVSGNPALRSLSAEADGAFLNSNPYIAAQFQAASDPVVRQYQTAMAPQTDSGFEASGRYGSGAMMNARSQNEQNLGKTLGDLSANIYGQDYANERGLMTQAGGLLGSNYLGGVNASTTAAGAGGDLALRGLSTELGGFGTAGNLEQTGYSNAGSLATAGANTGLAGINSGMSGLSSAAGATNAGYGTAAGAYGTGGALDISNLGKQNEALGTLQSGYQGGNSAALQGLALQPSVLQSNITPSMDILAGGQGFSNITQAQIQDAMSRFYGNELSPWQNAQMASAFIGGPYAGSSTQTTPYFTNPVAGALGAGAGALSLYNGANNAGLFGSAGSAAGNTWSSPAYDAAGSFLGMDAGGGSAGGGGIGSILSSIFGIGSIFA